MRLKKQKKKKILIRFLWVELTGNSNLTNEKNISTMADGLNWRSIIYNSNEQTVKTTEWILITLTGDSYFWSTENTSHQIAPKGRVLPTKNPQMQIKWKILENNLKLLDQSLLHHLVYSEYHMHGSQLDHLQNYKHNSTLCIGRYAHMFTSHMLVVLWLLTLHPKPPPNLEFKL